MMAQLPPFWVPFLCIMAVCIFMSWREDRRHGPHRKDDEENWTPRYAFYMAYAGKISILAGFCALMQAAAWMMGADP